MNRLKKFLTSPITLVIAFGLAIALLVFSSVGGARAALTYYSETYASQVEMHDIGVTLVENGQDVSNRDYYYEVADGTWNEHTGVLLGRMLETTDGRLELSKKYTEQLAVKNTGTIDTYVRVTVYKYWIDANGNKTRAIDPAMIDLHLVNLVGEEGASCWMEDTSAATAERTVLYYTRLLPGMLNAENEEAAMTPLFSDTIRINGNIASHVSTVTNEAGITVSTYDYNGYQFVLEATVDAVQNHNAEDAILSAWGKQVTISNSTLSLE